MTKGTGKIVTDRSHLFIFDDNKTPYSKTEAWLWLYFHACHSPTKIDGPRGEIKLDRGELSYSAPYMAKAWRQNPRWVQRFLDKLKAGVSVQSRNAQGVVVSKRVSICVRIVCGQSVITICNYDEMTSFETHPDSDARKEVRKEARKEARTIKTNYKTTNEERTYNPSPSAQGSGSIVSQMYSGAFEEWYSTFPKRTGKFEANRAYTKALKATTHQELMTATANMVRWRENELKIQRQNPRHFVPDCKHPATWLNQGCWEDELEFTPAPQRAISVGV